MELSERLVQLAQELGATSVHLVYFGASHRWGVIAIWGENELMQFAHKGTPEDAVDAAFLGTQGNEHASHHAGD